MAVKKVVATPSDKDVLKRLKQKQADEPDVCPFC
jgi:hypothetical protein